MKPFLSSCAETPSNSAFAPASPMRFSKVQTVVRSGDVRRVRQPAEALVAHAVEQLIPICSSDRLYSRFRTRMRTIVSVGYGGRPPEG